MKRIETIEELKQIELNTLRIIVKFCNDNNITYYLTGGTLIGAVRHNGFIPWDDDIDIAMPREEYERLLKCFNVAGYRIATYKNTSGYYLPFAKAYNQKTILYEESRIPCNIGVGIDIFPLDGMSSVEIIEKWRWKKLDILHYAYIGKMWPLDKTNKLKKTILRIIGGVFPIKLLPVLVEKQATKFEYKKSKKVGNSVWGYGKKRETHEKIHFEETVFIPFEGDLMACPKGYHTVLSDTYGDYMELPPIEERIAQHSFKAFYVEDN